MQVMETRKTRLGAGYPDTLTGMNNQASTYMKKCRGDDAEKLLVQVMRTRKIKFGANHPDTLISMKNLAFSWKGQDRSAEVI